MIIGLDYGGTIADSDLMKSKWILDELGLNIPPWKTDRTSCIPALAEHMSYEEAERIYNLFGGFIYGGEYAKNAPEIPGALAGVEKLARGNEIRLITARPLNSIADSLDWLKEKKVWQYFAGWHSSVIRDESVGKILSKREICELYGITVLIDNDERHLRKINVSGLKRILIKNGATEDIKIKGIYVAKNWQDVVNEIEKIH